MNETEYDPLLTPAEVAAAFCVASTTVVRWANKGLLESIRTPGGHRRFRESQVRKLLAGEVNAKSAGKTEGNR